MPRKLRFSDGPPVLPAARLYVVRREGQALPPNALVGGQAKLEYLLVMIAVLFALLYAVRRGGPIQNAVGKVLTDSATAMSGAVSNAQKRLGL